jgi:hypothetical protein
MDGVDSNKDDVSRAYYVYALFDPRKSPPRPFYIGKGVGERMHDHGREEGESSKLRRIRAIKADDYEYFAQRLVTGLSETDAYRVEMELIASFGLESNGGMLTNEVQPAAVRSARKEVKARPGAEERVQMALKMIKDEVVAMAELNPQGITNAQVTNKLGLQSTHDGQHRNYLSHSILGVLMLDDRIIKVGRGTDARYFSPRNYVRRQER